MINPGPCFCGANEWWAHRRSEDAVIKIDAEGKPIREFGRECRFVACGACGAIKQLAFPAVSKQAYREFYRNYPPTTHQYTAKDYQHDRNLAKKRFQEYGIGNGQGKVSLDVGSGSGAFVDECREQGFESYGCEIAHYAYSKSEEWTYFEFFEDVHFPTDHFDLLTCHDVLEHVLDPLGFVQEMFRVLCQEGVCFVDYPRFFAAEGAHHWKADEHLWFLNEDQLTRLFRQAGFAVDVITFPIPSKVVFQLRKPIQIRPSIIVPPGIGDSYWSLVKMEAFLEREGLGLPDVMLVSPRPKKDNGHKRALPFLELFPFLNAGGEVFSAESPETRAIWMEAYASKGRTIFQDVLGCDYFISYNGWLSYGIPLEELDPDLETRWHTPRFVSLEQEQAKRDLQKKLGRYIVFYFIFGGTYKHWVDQFSLSNLNKSIRNIVAQTGCRPVFVGGVWDQGDSKLRDLIRRTPNAVSLVGETSVAQLFGILSGAEAVVGYPSGLSILGAVIGAPTLILWNGYYHRDFFRYACPPDTLGRNYFLDDTENLDVGYLVERTVSIVNGAPIEGRPIRPGQHETEMDWCPRKRPVPPPPPAAESIAKKSPSDPVPRRTTARARRAAEIRRRRQITPAEYKQPQAATSVTVACVLKSGGDFDERYVHALKKAVDKHSTVPFRFLCLTDLKEIGDCEIVPLADGFDGWWSKVELFRPAVFNTDRVVYFDLDTVIVRNIDELLSIDSPFCALRPWNKRNQELGRCASGVMVFRPEECHFLYRDFRGYHTTEGGDQAFLSWSLQKRKKKVDFLQDIFPGVYSYKRQCREDLPQDARVVCFHGRPRPDAVLDLQWVKDNWQ